MKFRRLAIALVVVALASIFAPSLALADDVLAGAKPVRRSLLMRESRHEVTGLAGMTLGDPYVRNILLGARYDMHLYDWLSFGGRLQVGLPVTTETYDEVDTKVTRTNDTFAMEATSLRLLGLAHVSVSPLVGKLLIFGESPTQYDIHVDLLGGIAGIGSTGDALTSGVSLALGVGAGFRLFFSDVLALNMGLETLTADRALAVNRDSKEAGKKLRFNTMLTIGVSFFMPPKVRRGQ
ncbi:MAG: hypothetical protein H6747_07460 [Deltaproteobacteria bacterium]|nr:hypothetical protein [Deltaproteobacteria bacterium]